TTTDNSFDADEPPRSRAVTVTTYTPALAYKRRPPTENSTLHVTSSSDSAPTETTGPPSPQSTAPLQSNGSAFPPPNGPTIEPPNTDATLTANEPAPTNTNDPCDEIGRASCRERGLIMVVCEVIGDYTQSMRAANTGIRVRY